MYKFPVIENISEVLPHIEGRSEFIVADREDHIIINYAVAFADTFPVVETIGDAIRRECRGLIFSKSDGRIISRPFHKFFNLGEKEETQPNMIKTILDDTISLEKLDGSMIRAYIIKDQIIFGTKMGNTDVAKMAQAYADRLPRHQRMDLYRFILKCLNNNMTPIFEFCSRAQRIVIDYPEDRLVVTAIRDMKTGQYMQYDLMISEAAFHGLEFVQTLDFDQSAKDVEGVVLRTSEGHMIKMKCDAYIRLHKAKDKISVEKNAVNAIINNEIDDILPELAQEDQDRVNTLSTALHEFLETRAGELSLQVLNDIRIFKDKKTYALECNRDQFLKAATFKLWDEPEGAYEYLVAQLIKSLGKIVNYNEFKTLWKFDFDYGAYNE